MNKKTTTTKKYNAEGKLIKETTIVEEFEDDSFSQNIETRPRFEAQPIFVETLPGTWDKYLKELREPIEMWNGAKPVYKNRGGVE